MIPSSSGCRPTSSPYRMGCKRILLSNDWYPTLTRPDVEVVDAADASVVAEASSSPTAHGASWTS